MKLEQVECGQCQLVFISPEALVCCTWREMFRNPIYPAKLVGFVVDECHLYKTWVCLHLKRNLLRSVKLFFGTLRSVCNAYDCNS